MEQLSSQKNISSRYRNSKLPKRNPHPMPSLGMSLATGERSLCYLFLHLYTFYAKLYSDMGSAVHAFFMADAPNSSHVVIDGCEVVLIADKVIRRCPTR